MTAASRVIQQSDNIFVVSAPSGTGKTTLNHMLVQKHKNIKIAISHTTRPIRPGEVDGKDYHFVNVEEFQKLKEANKLLESATVFDHYYGTSLDEVSRIIETGSKVILEIDVQGWIQTKKIIPSLHAVFIAPPSLKTIWQRLEGRATDSLVVRWKRLTMAKEEIKLGMNYEAFIINDDIDRAFAQLENLVVYNKPTALSREEGRNHCQALIDEYNSADWLLELKNKINER